MDNVIHECSCYLMSYMDLENCIDIWNMMSISVEDFARSHARKYVLANFHYILKSNAFLKLDYNSFTRFLEDDYLNIYDEEIVLDAFMEWIKNNPLQTQQYIQDLPRCVRLSLIRQSRLIECITTFKTNPELVTMVADAIRRQNDRKYDDEIESTYRKHTDLCAKILCTGGYTFDRVLSRCEVFDAIKLTVSNAAQLNTPRCEHGSCNTNNHQFVIGGFDGFVDLNSVEKLSPHKDTWELVAPMQERRSGLAVATSGRFIYAIGGYACGHALRSAEIYDTIRDKWEYLPSLSIPRRYLCAVSVNNDVFAIGGHNGCVDVGYSEQMNVKDRSGWTRADIMRVPSMCACINWYGNIVIYGGKSDMECSTAVVKGNRQYTVELCRRYGHAFVALPEIHMSFAIGGCKEDPLGRLLVTDCIDGTDGPMLHTPVRYLSDPTRDLACCPFFTFPPLIELDVE